MYHHNYTNYLQRELDFLKSLVSRFHEQEQVNVLELDVALLKTQEIYDQLLRIKLVPENAADEKKAEITVQEESIPVHEEEKPQVDPVKPEILAKKINSPDFHPVHKTPAQQKTGGEPSSKWQTAPLSALGTGIGLNDKFLYTRELFKGDSDLYNDTIRHLDSANSLEEAFAFIREHFDWDEKNKTVQNLMSLVHRRHGGK